MALRFRRRGARKGQQPLLGADTDVAARVLRAAYETQLEAGRGFHLRPLVDELFVREPTADVRALKVAGLDAETFYDEEIAPNWDDLSGAQRAAKIEAFTRLANALQAVDEDPGGMRPLVRTKLLVLAWAHDDTYGEDYLARIDEAPERFGAFELAR